jgi:predicted ester cyclase
LLVSPLVATLIGMCDIALLGRRLIDDIYNNGTSEPLEDYVKPALAEALRGWVAEYRSWLPDFRFEEDQVLAGDGVVLVFGRFRGTHTAAMAPNDIAPDGLEATGNEVGFKSTHLLSIEDDHIVHVSGHVDRVKMFSQLGAPVQTIGVAKGL